MPNRDPLYQKGANGIVAEYVCAYELAVLLELNQLTVRTPTQTLLTMRDQAIERVASDLSETQLERAKQQGKALAEHIYHNDSVIASARQQKSKSTLLDVLPVGGGNDKEDPADLVLQWLEGTRHSGRAAYSLKATAGGETSLGSKSSRAMLTRLFLGKEQASDEEFRDTFGQPGSAYLEHAELYRRCANDFYESTEGKAFLDAYEKRKGTRKVNNRLRRKEVGDWFNRKHGYKSEHRYAQLLVDCTGKQMQCDTAGLVEAWSFLLGRPDMNVLEAVAGGDGIVQQIISSKNESKYQRLASLLSPGLIVAFNNSSGKSIVTVTLQNGSGRGELTMAVWKDGTVQFKAK